MLTRRNILCDVYSNEGIPELALNDSFQFELHWFMRCVIISLISTCNTVSFKLHHKNDVGLSLLSFYPGFFFTIDDRLQFSLHLSKDRIQFMVTCSQRTFHQHGTDA